LATPDMPMLRAAAFDRSMILPFHEGTAVIDRNRYGAAIAQILGVTPATASSPTTKIAALMLASPMLSEGPLEFYDKVPNLPGHMPPLEEPTALGGRR